MADSDSSDNTSTRRGTRKSTASNLARVRDNQRRSRARRKQYLLELEAKIRDCEQLGVEASAEMQNAARRVLEDNYRLRAYLHLLGKTDSDIDAFTTDDVALLDNAIEPDAVRSLKTQLSSRKPYQPSSSVPPPSDRRALADSNEVPSTRPRDDFPGQWVGYYNAVDPLPVFTTDAAMTQTQGIGARFGIDVQTSISFADVVHPTAPVRSQDFASDWAPEQPRNLSYQRAVYEMVSTDQDRLFTAQPLTQPPQTTFAMPSAPIYDYSQQQQQQQRRQQQHQHQRPSQLHPRRNEQ